MTVTAKLWTGATASGSPLQTHSVPVSSGSWATSASPALADGVYTARAEQTDTVGNTGLSGTRTFTVDTAAPNASVTGPSGPTNDTTPTFPLSSNELGSTFECRVDSVLLRSLHVAAHDAGAHGGPHTFEVRAIDQWQCGPDARVAVVHHGRDRAADHDRRRPHRAHQRLHAHVRLLLHRRHGQLRVPRGQWLVHGLHLTAHHRRAERGRPRHRGGAKDPAGNVDASPASRSFTVDVTAPPTTIDGPSGPITDTTPTFTFSSTDGTASSSSAASTAARSRPAPRRTRPACSPKARTPSRSGQGPGQRRRHARLALHHRRHHGAADHDRRRTVRADQRLDTPFDFSSTDGTASFECRVDSGSFTACTSPHTTATLSEAPYTIEVRAKDPAGNVDATSSRSFTVDVTASRRRRSTAPRARPTTPRPPSTSPPPTARTFECRVDSGEYAPAPRRSPRPRAGRRRATFEVQGQGPGRQRRRHTRQPLADGGRDGSADDDRRRPPRAPTNDPTPTFTFSSTRPA